MTPLLFVAAAVVAGAVSLFASRPSIKAAAYVFLFAMLLGIWWTALGRPRPELFSSTVGTVRGYSFDEPQEIDVLILTAGARVPVLRSLPWNEARAAALADAAKKACQTGAPITATGRGSWAALFGGGGGQAGTVFGNEPPPPPLAPKQSVQ